MQSHIQRIFDLQLLSLATNYNLKDRKERKRSVAAARRLFFGIVRVTKPALFIEAGAERAEASRLVKAKYAPDSRVVAFEANPYVFDRFRQEYDFERAGVDYRHQALSNTKQDVTFYIRTGIDGNPRDKTLGQSSILKRMDPTTEYEQVKVSADSLDNFFRDSPEKTCALWIDVEGANRQILEGAEETIKKAICLQIEVEDLARWEGQWLSGDVTAYMLDRGMIPVARDFEYRSQYNILFVRDDVLQRSAVRRQIEDFHYDRSRSKKPQRTWLKRLSNLLSGGRYPG
jgi:FkbM family methyltransferase